MVEVVEDCRVKDNKKGERDENVEDGTRKSRDTRNETSMSSRIFSSSLNYSFHDSLLPTDPILFTFFPTPLQSPSPTPFHHSLYQPLLSSSIIISLSRSHFIRCDTEFI